MSDYPQAPPPPPPPGDRSGDRPGDSSGDEPTTATGWDEPREATAWDQPGGATQEGGNGPAVGALICGILALVLFPLFPLAIILGIVAIILGVIGVRRARDPATGRKGMAVAGLITGGLGLVLAVFVLIGVAVMLSDPDMREPFERLWEGDDPEEVLEDMERQMQELEEQQQ